MSTQALLGVLRRGAGFVASAVSILGSAGSAAIVNGPCIDASSSATGNGTSLSGPFEPTSSPTRAAICGEFRMIGEAARGERGRRAHPSLLQVAHAAAMT